MRRQHSVSNMFPTAVLVFLGTLLAADCEIHTLAYIYTGFSHPVSAPGIHQFTAMGLLDNKIIDYFDSDSKMKIPQQPWMDVDGHLPKDYWSKGTETRKSKQQWFQVNINILMERLKQNNSDLHILQWMHGCEGSTNTNGNLKFHRSMDSYSYDGDDFLSFNDDDGIWVAANQAALDTKRKWDDVKNLKAYTKSYLEGECIDWLQKFVNFEKQHLETAAQPDMYMFATKSKVENSVVLTCMATELYFKNVTLQMRRNGYVLTEVDGVRTSRVRPNHDSTYQIRDTVEILKTDTSEFTCELFHGVSSAGVKMVWDHKLPHESNGRVFIAVGLFLIPLIIAAVLIILKKKKLACFQQAVAAPKGENKTMEPQTEAPLLSIDHNKNEEVKKETKGDDESTGSLDSSDSGVSSE